MTRARQWLLWGPFALAGVILLAWFGVWRAGAETIDRALLEFAKAESERGGVVAHGPMRAKGFPFFLRGEIRAFSIERGQYRFEADVLYLHAAPWSPQRIVFSTGPSLKLLTPAGVWAISAAGARASIEAASDKGWLFKAEANALDGVRGQSALKTGRSVVNIAPDATVEGAYAIAARVQDARIKNTRGETDILRIDAALTAHAASRRIVIHGVDSDFGPSRVGLSGALGVDAEGFLTGDLAASIENPAEIADTLRVLGAIRAEEARSLEAGLALVAVAGGGRIEAPLVFADGETRLAGARIARAPRVGQP